jgi:hypothetical protein
MSESARPTPVLDIPALDSQAERRRPDDQLAPMQGLLMAVLLSAGLWALIALAFRALR